MALRLWSPAFAAKLEARLADTPYDVVQVEAIEMARYMLSSGNAPHPAHARRFVFEDHNCEYLLQQRTFETDLRAPSRWIGAAYSFVQWRKLRVFEAAVCRAADRVIAVSDLDAHALRRLVPGLQVQIAPNGIDVQGYAQIPDSQPPLPPHGREGVELVFTATMDFRPNVDAVLWFAHKVLPLIRQAEPEARFVVVGRNPHRRLDVLRGRPDVVLTGAVDDVRPYIAGAAVYVVPLRVGGGTRFKILEAGAMSKAVVSTSLGCEGFPVQDGRELLIADSPRAFADAVVALARDAGRRAELGAAARAFVETYDWKNIIPHVEAVYGDKGPLRKV
jgi:glycosyltransferase involved in cell wall biosynthesis